MSEFPYVAVPSKLASLFERLKGIGVPDRVSVSWLQSIGFTSSNDRTMLPILEYIGFVDTSKQPTDRWMEYRNERSSKKVLAIGVRSGYNALYETYYDAQHRNEDELRNFFRSRSTAGEEAIRRTVKTFQELCSIADFGENQEKVVEAESEFQEPVGLHSEIPDTSPPFSPDLNINIQIHISADAKDGQIEKIFSSMATHLFGMGSGAKRKTYKSEELMQSDE